MLTAATEPQRFRRMATPRMASIKRRLREPLVSCTLRVVARRMAPPAGTTAVRLVRQQMATSTQAQTAPSTKIRGVAGKATKAEAGTASRNPAAQATTPLLPGAGEDRKGAAAHPPSAAAVGAGEQGRIALVVGEAQEAEEAGAAAAGAGAGAVAGDEFDGAARLWCGQLVSKHQSP